MLQDRVLQLIERGNQRGERMLSVMDLLDAETLTEKALCWLLAHILEGGSWLVGARPGGAGKTTVMSALLAMLPAGEEVYLTDGLSDWQTAGPGACILSYEISPGHYDGYIWGGDVRRLASQAQKGVRVVTNLHADTVEEARRQVVDQCGAQPEHFASLGAFLPIRLERSILSTRRRVGPIRHFRKDAWDTLDETAPLSPREEELRLFLVSCARCGYRTVPEVRAAWLEWLAGKTEA